MLPLTFSLIAVLSAKATARSPYDVPKKDWDAFNATVAGRLAYGVPFARSCFSQAGVNVTSGTVDCATVQANYGKDTFRVSQFGTTTRAQWEACQKTNQGCLLDPSNPSNAIAFSPPQVCNQGSVSPYYIDVRNAADVAQAFTFSKRTGVPLSIKNTGHDFAGRSSAPGTLALWTHNMKYINYSKSFVPAGCSVQGVPALTYGAGQDMESLYLFSEANNITFIGGSAKTVGAAGGWVMGGGHSILTNVYGLGVDRVLQFRIVTPDGQSRIANACQNADLFWALRGGGGGTFGVVLEATSEVVPKPVSTVSLWIDLNPTSANVRGLTKVMIDNAVQWSKDGWGGYVYPFATLLANPRLNATAAAASLKPLIDFVNAAPSEGAQARWSEFGSFLPLFESITSLPFASGVSGAFSSRLLPHNLFEGSKASTLFNATLETLDLSGGYTAFYFTTPFSYKATAGATSVAPAWRGAVWHVISFAEWSWDASPEVSKAGYSKLTRSMEPLRRLTPSGGAYQNEADVYEPDWSISFWGSNYARLYALKLKYDPYKLLDCYHCVGWTGKKTLSASCYL